MKKVKIHYTTDKGNTYWKEFEINEAIDIQSFTVNGIVVPMPIIIEKENLE